MAITTYAELQTAITTWMVRSDLSGNATDMIALAEARLNRLLDVVETDVTLTGTADSRTIDVSSYSIIEPLALWFVNSAGDEEEVLLKAAGTFPYTDDSAEPAFAALNGTDLKFNCPLDSAYSFRFRYRGRFALSVSVTTNALLDDHPDVYLAASIMWGGLLIQDSEAVAGYKAVLDEFIMETKSHLAQKKRGVLSVDPALSARQNDTWWRQGT